MKRIKICMFTIMLAMSMFVLTACSNKNSRNNKNSSGTSQSTTASESSTSGGTSNETINGGAGSSGVGINPDWNNNSQNQQESKGVIGGMMDDIEQGADDMMNGSNAYHSSEGR